MGPPRGWYWAGSTANAGVKARPEGKALSLYDFSSPRLFVDAPLGPETEIAPTKDQSKYLLNVLRLGDGDAVLAFNGRDGEWRMAIRALSRKQVVLVAHERTREQTEPCDLHYLFAPLKHARLDYVVQKAVEMGAGLLQPVITRRTQNGRINLERMQANAIEAAEQCGILCVPDVKDGVKLDKLLSQWSDSRRLIFCDEDAPIADPVAALRTLARGPLAVIIGPEGGFDPQEREWLLRVPHVTRLSLGPRILRGDTAGVAALAVVQAALGDWA
jgi:16S rRNA (uracil1498-N3)-methyltransferase